MRLWCADPGLDPGQQLTAGWAYHIYSDNGKWVANMKPYPRHFPLLPGLLAGLVCVLLAVWVVPCRAVDIVRKSGGQVKTDPPPTPKDREPAPADTTGLTRGLLDNVRSQREKGTASDTLDTWIDRDGDGVNDRLKKSAAPEGTMTKGFVPPAEPKKAEPTTPTDTVKKAKPKSSAQPQKKRRH